MKSGNVPDSGRRHDVAWPDDKRRVRPEARACSVPVRRRPRRRRRGSRRALSKAPATPTASTDHNAVIRRYCVGCHSDARKTGGLSLATFDVTHAAQNAEVAEKVIRKLHAGMMPPPLSPRPDAATQAALVTTLETTIDAAATAKPNPGARTFQRLNRPEYARAVRDLLGLDVDAGSWLPLDQKSANFDNIADVQSLSPTLLEAYLNAAAAISTMAVGDRNAPAIDHTYTNPGYLSQHPWDHVDGAPYGTRGGMVVNHVFPADAEYVFEVRVELREQRAVRGHRHLDQRRARRADRIRERPRRRCGRPRRAARPDRTDPRARRPAARRRRVRAEARGTVRGSRSARTSGRSPAAGPAAPASRRCRTSGT